MENLKYGDVDREILRPLTRPGRAYWLWVFLFFLGMLLGLSAWTYQILTGMGSAGYHPSVMWVTYIVNFVFWIGIAHSGTLISAILYLFRAKWRTAISRASEAMTIFAVIIASSPCVLAAEAGTTRAVHAVRVTEDCTGCRECLDLFECPALVWDEAAGKAGIDQGTCARCGVCLRVCPVGAIVADEGEPA